MFQHYRVGEEIEREGRGRREGDREEGERKERGRRWREEEGGGREREGDGEGRDDTLMRTSVPSIMN
jgi:hypothetical protein